MVNDKYVFPDADNGLKLSELMACFALAGMMTSERDKEMPMRDIGVRCRELGKIAAARLMNAEG